MPLGRGEPVRVGEEEEEEEEDRELEPSHGRILDRSAIGLAADGDELAEAETRSIRSRAGRSAIQTVQKVCTVYPINHLRATA